MRGFFKFLIVSGVGLGGVLAGRYTDTNFDQHANTSKKRWCFRPIILYDNMKYGPKFAVHYTKLLRKNGQWGGERGGGILYLKKIYDTGFGVYTPQDQRSRRIY